MAPEMVAGVDAAREGVLKPAHAVDQIRIRRADGQMVVIIHQNPGVDFPPATQDSLEEGVDKQLPVVVIPHDRLPAISPRHDVINRPGVLDARRTGHSHRMVDYLQLVNFLSPCLLTRV